MRDRTWEEEYNTEPFEVSERVSMAPTMAGGIALLVDGEHIDHFYEHELEILEETAEEALNTLEHEGHSTASERKFDRHIQEAIGYQAEITYFLYHARVAANDGDYREINYDTLKQVIGMLQTHASMLDLMSQQLQNWESQGDGR